MVVNNYATEKQPPVPAAGVLKIYTLGRFQICSGNHTLFDGGGRNKKIWDLLMYLITNRGKYISPETILDTIWPNNDFDNPKNVLKNLVYRLKQNLERLQPEARFHIDYNYGGYGWNMKASYWIDVDAFEVLCVSAGNLLKSDPYQAADKYREALALYQGHYLPECHSCLWVLPKRQYYYRLFVKGLSELLAFEKEHRLYPQLAEDCEKALAIENLDENIHLYYIEALLAQGKTASALAHYEYITSLKYRELGAKPSPGMQRIYRAIKAKSEKMFLDFSDLRKMLIESDEGQSALFCEPETLLLFCQMERRRAERVNRPFYLGGFTLTKTDPNDAQSGQFEKAMECLKNLIMENSGKAVIVAPFGENQFALLLPGLNLEKAEKLLQIIEEAFKEVCTPDKAVLNSSVYTFPPTGTMVQQE